MFSNSTLFSSLFSHHLHELLHLQSSVQCCLVQLHSQEPLHLNTPSTGCNHISLIVYKSCLLLDKASTKVHSFRQCFSCIIPTNLQMEATFVFLSFYPNIDLPDMLLFGHAGVVLPKLGESFQYDVHV